MVYYIQEVKEPHNKEENKMEEKMPNASEIVKYWMNKGLTPKGDVVDLLAKEHDADVKMVIVDIGEPSCWACDSPIVKVYDDSKYDDLLKTNPFAIWDLKSVTSKLDRAHIQPKALTKNNDVSNLFLLCKECHEHSPDHMNVEYFFRFVWNRGNRFVQGLDMQNLNDFYDIAIENNIDLSLESFKGIELDSSQLNTHSISVVQTTLLSELIETIKENQKK